jgi:hypothetical protein
MRRNQEKKYKERDQRVRLEGERERETGAGRGGYPGALYNFILDVTWW